MTGEGGRSASVRWQDRLRPIVETVLREQNVPGIVMGAARTGSPAEFLAVGTDAAGVPLDAGTLFPVASITKLATALAVLRVVAGGVDGGGVARGGGMGGGVVRGSVAGGALSLDDPLSIHLPDAAAAREGVTVRTLLAHTSGLPVDLPRGAAPYAPGLDWPAVSRACMKIELETSPEVAVRYSNLGPGLLAIVVERITGMSFARAVEQLVLSPLGIEGYLGAEPPRTPARLTGDLGKHAGTEIEAFTSPFWRSLAFPWAGLVTTAEGALRLVHAFAGLPDGFLPRALVEEATRNQTDALPGGFWPPLAWDRCPWGLGVELRGSKDPHWTPIEASPGSYGHSGSSGCLVWSDPEAGVSWVILGARTFQRWWRDWPRIGAAVLSALR